MKKVRSTSIGKSMIRPALLCHMCRLPN